MALPLRLDFVSDVVCPWCAVGLWSLRIALDRLGPAFPVELRFRPFELNPDMPPEGEDATEHLARKYGIGPVDIARNREGLRARGEAVGFHFAPGGRQRVVNTFDAHRLIHWAGTLDASSPLRLKEALLIAYHGQGRDVSESSVLEDVVAGAGLEPAAAREVLAGDAFAQAVRDAEWRNERRGVHAVPSLIMNGVHLIQGGQPPEVFEQALRQVAAEIEEA